MSWTVATGVMAVVLCWLAGLGQVWAWVIVAGLSATLGKCRYDNQGLLATNRRVLKNLEADRVGDGQSELSSNTVKLGQRLLQESARMVDQRDGLQQELKDLQTILESMHEGVISLDSKDRIVAANPAAAKILQIERSRMLGKLLQEVVRNSELRDLGKSIGENSQNLEKEIELSGRVTLLVRGTRLYNRERQRLGTLLVINDITRLRRLEHMRTYFVANVSHELKTPLTSIKGYAETLLGIDKDDLETARRFAEKISRNADRLQSIIEDLLMLSRVEQQGLDEEELTCLHLGHLLDTAFDEIHEKAGKCGVELIREPEDKQLQVRGHPQLLSMALVNLLDNAIKYGDKNNGQVKVSCKRLDSGFIEIAIEDNGTGIAAEHLPHLFDRFYRVDKARSRAMGGTGLGLSIVKHIVLSHGGEVDVKSTFGKGSTFYVRLPATVRDSPASPSEVTSSPEGPEV